MQAFNFGRLVALLCWMWITEVLQDTVENIEDGSEKLGGSSTLMMSVLVQPFLLRKALQMETDCALMVAAQADIQLLVR
jgi:hypothetical protein